MRGFFLCPSCDNAITGGKLVSGNKLKNKLSSGEFKTIQNEGESTVWRYFCLVVNADLLNLDGWGREMNVKTDKLGQRQKHLQAENNGFQT